MITKQSQGHIISIIICFVICKTRDYKVSVNHLLNSVTSLNLQEKNYAHVLKVEFNLMCGSTTTCKFRFIFLRVREKLPACP